MYNLTVDIRQKQLRREPGAFESIRELGEAFICVANTSKLQISIGVGEGSVVHLLYITELYIEPLQRPLLSTAFLSLGSHFTVITFSFCHRCQSVLCLKRLGIHKLKCYAVQQRQSTKPNAYRSPEACEVVVVLSPFILMVVFVL